MTTTILHVTDTHLGATGGPERELQGELAWERLLAHVASQQPDLVVVTGDLVVDDPDDEADQARAHELLARLPVPYRVVPGNHDVGDHAVRHGLPTDWHGKQVTSERVQRWVDRWGSGAWHTELAQVRCIGLNSQLVGSGLPEEAAQLGWLAALMRDHPADERPLLVFTHEAIVAGVGVAADSWMAAPSAGAAQLRSILTAAQPVTVFSGHTHRFHDFTAARVRQVTAPSLSGPIPLRDDMTQARGDRRAGWVEITVTAGEVVVSQRLLASPAAALARENGAAR